MVRFKLYFDKDLEEDWLKEMSLKGWAFKNFFLGVYTFEACEPGEYNYQIDLLDNWKGDKDDFASFMEESGVEVISQWYRWVYIRKKASDGPFEMYTDVDSKITQYNRIKRFFTVGLIVETICFFVELSAAVEMHSGMVWAVTAFVGMVALAFLKIVWKCEWKIKQLQREKKYN
jgi:hypothetical protein